MINIKVVVQFAGWLGSSEETFERDVYLERIWNMSPLHILLTKVSADVRPGIGLGVTIEAVDLAALLVDGQMGPRSCTIEFDELAGKSGYTIKSVSVSMAQEEGLSGEIRRLSSLKPSQ